MELIFCAKGNRRFAEIARDAGFLLGAQLPGTVYLPIQFADQDWKTPNRKAYMAALAAHRPAMASVLDLEREDQLCEVLDWAEECAQYASTVMIIPKVFGIIGRLPSRIGGADVRLGYSVPTQHGGTDVPSWEFGDRPVHLLGGSPHRQMRLAHTMRVVSADGNMAMKMATTRCHFWTNGSATYARDRFWPQLKGANGDKFGIDAPYEAFRRSCENIMRAWLNIV